MKLTAPRPAVFATVTLSALFLTVGCAANGPQDSATGSNDAEGTSESVVGDWEIPDVAPEATISVLGLPDLDAGNMQLVLDAFAEDYPSITVEYESVPFADLNAAIDAGVSAMDGRPDVYWADMPRIAALNARGYTTDLTEQFAPYREAWDEASYLGASDGDTLQGVPIANSTQLLYYNKDLLDASNIQYPSSDPSERITWEELAENAGTIVGDGAKSGLLFGQIDRYYQIQALPMSLGGSAGGTGEGNLTPDITSDAWIQAMEFYGQIHAEGLSPRAIPADQMEAEFLNGSAAYYVNGPWVLPAMNASDINWGVALHPYFAEGEPVTATGSWALALNPFSEKKEAAAIFMKWMSVDDGGGYIRYRPDAELPANIEGKPLYFGKDVFATDEGQVAGEIIEYETANTTVNRLGTVGYVEFEEIMGRAFSDIRNGAEPAAVLEAASAELATAWAVYR